MARWAADEPPTGIRQDPLVGGLFMCVQWCVADGFGLAAAAAVDADLLVDADEVVAVEVADPACAADPPVLARATPVAPAPSPPASTAVMISRLALLPRCAAIGFLPPERRAGRRPARADVSLGGQPGAQPVTGLCPGSEQCARFSTYAERQEPIRLRTAFSAIRCARASHNVPRPEAKTPSPSTSANWPADM
jgi:hypothetical protein